MSDSQDQAEDFDEDVTGLDDPVLSDEAETEFPPDGLQGVPFADADVTDQSFAERTAAENPEDEPSIYGFVATDGVGEAADERLEQILDLTSDDDD